MQYNTLILSTSKVIIPKVLTIDFVTRLINRGLTAIDYFGIEIDNPEDYIEKDMKEVSKSISYFEFQFETSDNIDYDSLTEL
ncbi:hypothetical protein [Flavobacterium poyangense]|uniref:hypothetical protein n=1 Tax=Flavobacterium poyangense TaxID=2204302 RepID=UPI00141E6C1A|nr:hypothetical protein [Flavobacterium sp. JXAS1]